MRRVLWAGALWCCRTQFPQCHNNGCLRRMSPRRRLSTEHYNSVFTACHFGRNFLLTKPLMSTKAIIMLFVAFWTCLAFLGRGEADHFHCEDCCFVLVIFHCWFSKFNTKIDVHPLFEARVHVRVAGWLNGEWRAIAEAHASLIKWLQAGRVKITQTQRYLAHIVVMNRPNRWAKGMRFCCLVRSP